MRKARCQGRIVKAEPAKVVQQSDDIGLQAKLQTDIPLFYNHQYSMKHQKSSFSLHSTSASIFKEKSQNVLFGTSSKFQIKRQPSYSKEFASIYNARGRLKHCSEQHLQLQQLSESIGLTNKNLRLELTFLRGEVIEKLLKQVEGELTMDIKQLKKQITIRKRSDLLQFESITQILGSMQKSHKEVKRKVEELESRVSHLENVMGVGNPLPNLV